MDIYSLRMFLIIIILLFSVAWLIYKFKDKLKFGGKNPDTVAKRGFDGGGTGPLFGDQMDDVEVPEEPRIPAGIPIPGGDKPGSISVAKELSSGLVGKLSGLVDKFTDTSGTDAAPPATEGEAKQPAATAKEDVKVIYFQLHSRQREGLNGPKLLSLFEQHSMTSGKMDVFHRQLAVGQEQKTAFSVINGEEPGTLIPEQLKERNTHRIMFYISLNDYYNPLRSFEEMLEVAQKFAASLDASLYDDQGCALSEQNIQYQRDLVKEFVHRRNVNNAAAQ